MSQDKVLEVLPTDPEQALSDHEVSELCGLSDSSVSKYLSRLRKWGWAASRYEVVEAAATRGNHRPFVRKIRICVWWKLSGGI